MPHLLLDYQKSFLENVRHTIERHWYLRKPHIRILDMGCETSGVQLHAMSMLTRGEVVGINVGERFPTQAAIAQAGPRVRMLNMSGMNLDFPSETFDLVVSANVLEHVSNPSKFVSEASRVLKNDGVCWMETAPVWTSARGHHVMESMVKEDCPWETSFVDDGTIIPDWSHLCLDRYQMQQVITGKVAERTRDWILHYLYESGDLNKTPWREVEESLRTAFSEARIHKNRLPGFDPTYMPKDSIDDYTVFGFSAVCRKRPVSWFRKRLCWRLRRIGL